jgi:hypothetical protein cdiviTM7_02704
MTKMNKKGFTIIEVVLVLAIAGLIFLMVFLALPALRRGQRDTQRKSDLNRAGAALTDYKAAHRGNIPSNSGTPGALKWEEFVYQYLTASGKDEFIDPSGLAAGQDSSLKSYQFVPLDASQDPPSVFEGEGGAQNKIYYTVNAKCQEGGQKVEGAQGGRVVALRMKLEGAGYHCISD